MTTSPSDHPRSKGGSAHGRQISARRVRDLITASIREGHINPDAPLAEEDLIRLFDTSRGSVRAALAQLRDTGFLERRPRVGTKVTHRGVIVPLTDIDTDSEHVYVDNIEDRIVPSFPLVRERLGIEEPTVRMIENLLVTDDEVIGMRTAYFSAHYDDDPDMFVGPVNMTTVLRDFFHVERGDVLVIVGSEAADAHTAKAFGIAVGSPLIVREVTYHDPTGRPVQTVFDRLRGDRVRLEGTTR
ncbi:GntR family transcriptional regulator [Curtobacterium sp. MCBD17_019]|uniref:GntR family transcriptional regulator n=1 Tax=Curtobacterium sp. MCBD17_019 TaxID=2175669 RepID=UPI000DAA9DE4|nr:GntR family transcriptional regulator [Curtobacterium sp. MCBD17_019]PZE76589.1 GntR family transcriptional regulator [Curtobacterium sp. MCBD17_019]